MSVQRLSPIGKAALRSREGRRLNAYRDSKGVWTIGDGSTTIAGRPVRKGDVLTNAEADALFDRQIAGYEAAVRKAATVPLAPHEFDALGSICWNIGVGGLAGSTFMRRINARAGAGAIDDAIMMWTKDKELVSRRRAEADQFRTPYAIALPKGRSTDAKRVAGSLTGPVVPPIAAKPAAAPTWLDRLGAWLGRVLDAPPPLPDPARG